MEDCLRLAATKLMSEPGVSGSVTLVDMLGGLPGALVRVLVEMGDAGFIGTTMKQAYFAVSQSH
jgi:hypothetical protein